MRCSNVQPWGAGGDEGVTQAIDDYRIRESWLALSKVSPTPMLSLGVRVNIRGLRLIRALRARNLPNCAGPC